MVNTKFVGNEDIKKNKFLCISPKLAAQSSLRDIGHTPGTEGAFRHILGRGMMPGSVFSKMMFKVSK